jgi:histidinol-phosphate aminotransferase
MRVRVEDYRREAGSIVIANPKAPTGVALPRAEIARLLEGHPDIPVVIDEAYVDFGGESAVPLIADHPNLLVVQTMSRGVGAGCRYVWCEFSSGSVGSPCRCPCKFG